ncbi:STAS domain-containing protein [Kitasatospora aureofaciens]|nr:STAS domain-containing protein [Kitasatospora aureofaciens]UKZ09320.1 STAS domain-containing protein [Streptomyces viridifaciens]
MMPAQETTVASPSAPTTATGLTVQVRRTADGAAVCSLTGDLDVETLTEARTALEGATVSRPTLLVADLEHVGFCDSSGLNLLLKTRMNASTAGIPFRLAAPSHAIMRLLDITGANSVFSLHTSVDEALSAPR